MLVTIVTHQRVLQISEVPDFDQTLNSDLQDKSRKVLIVKDTFVMTSFVLVIIVCNVTVIAAVTFFRPKDFKGYKIFKPRNMSNKAKLKKFIIIFVTGSQLSRVQHQDMFHQLQVIS